MELKYLLLVMALLYLLPELFRRRKPKTYEYPNIPDKVPQSTMTVTSSEFQFEGKKSVIPAPIVMPPSVSIPAVSEEHTPWQDQLQPHMIQNGYIFAEILQPPRVYRSMQGNRSRGRWTK